MKQTTNGHPRFELETTRPEHKNTLENTVELWTARVVVLGFFAGILAWAGGMVWLAVWTWSAVVSQFQ